MIQTAIGIVVGVFAGAFVIYGLGALPRLLS